MHRFTLSAAALAALLASTACSLPTGDSVPIDAQKTPAATVLPVTRIRAEPYPLTYYSGIADSARVVVTDANHWGQVWSTIWRYHSAAPPLPQIDFGNEVLAVAALGTRSSGGFAIYVDSAYQHGDHVEVVVHKVSPGGHCGVTAAITQPVDVARIPATGLPLRFRERATARQCS